LKPINTRKNGRNRYALFSKIMIEGNEGTKSKSIGKETLFIQPREEEKLKMRIILHVEKQRQSNKRKRNTCWLIQLWFI